MSRQNTRITRWLMGSPEENSATAGNPTGLPDTPEPNTTTPPWPTRDPQARRPRVQGLQEATRDVRRGQLAAPAHRGQGAVPATLIGLLDDLAKILTDLSGSWEGLSSTVITTENGTLLAHMGTTATEAESAALATSHLGDSLGLAADQLDVAAASLRSGGTIVVARIPHPEGAMLLRTTSRGPALGLAVAQTQRAARVIASL